MKVQPYSEEAGKAVLWWQSLSPREENGRAIPGDRAALARLRRADSLLEAAAEPVTIALYDKLRSEHAFHRKSTLVAERDLPRAALMAAVLAHVKEHDRALPVAAAIGKGTGDDEALVSPLRFKRIVAAREPEDLLIAFRRLIAMLGGTANVRDLARLLLAFTDPNPEKADIARTIFAFHYHGAGSYAPDANTDTDGSVSNPNS